MARKKPLLSIIQAAGWPIWPLILCSILALAFIVERFISLVEEEAGRCPITGSNVTWMWRHQARMATLSLIAAESTYRLWQKNWTDFCAKQKLAA